MPDAEYKIFFDNAAAPKERLAQIEDITIEQAVDMAWEARLVIPVCVNGDGKWEGETEAWMKPYKRVRIELNPGDGKFVPLIDGPVVGHDAARSSLPGKSMITLVVHDDSAYLHQKDEYAKYPAGPDSATARKIFESAANIKGGFDIETSEMPPDNPAQATMQRGTKMTLLRQLARRNGDFHAYVLPTATKGESLRCFKKLPKKPDGLPPLVLFGEKRNTLNLDIKRDPRAATNYNGATMSLRDGKIISATASFRDAELLGEESASETQGNETERLLPPGQNDSVDLTAAARGKSAKSGYATEVTGDTLPFCYAAALSPYRAVSVQMSDTELSANYVIFKVTHKLTRSIYTQSFTLRGDAVSPAKGGSASAPAASASASASFNVQLSIF